MVTGRKHGAWNSERKRAQVSCYISADLRAALVVEAERSGRSISQVAELWLEQARVLHMTGQAPEGGQKERDAEAPLK